MHQKQPPPIVSVLTPVGFDSSLTLDGSSALEPSERAGRGKQMPGLHLDETLFFLLICLGLYPTMGFRGRGKTTLRLSLYL
jgi:hypothetical protein